MSGRSPRRAGRRPGSPDTRGVIVDAARDLFIADGFGGTSVRAIAERAEVDPALVYHYFGSKRDLLIAAIRLQVNPLDVLRTAMRSGTGPPGVRIVSAMTAVWESPHGESLAAVISGALSEQAVRTLVAESVGNALMPAVLDLVGVPDTERTLRGGLLESVICGLVLGRYVLQVEPLASLPRSEVVRNLGAVLDHLLRGRLG